MNYRVKSLSRFYNFITENNIPMGANVWNNKLFITIPRRRAGVPSTLNYVWANSTDKHSDVPLIPYPDWDTNILEGSRRNGQKFVSVYRVAVDPCDRLWFVDTGVIEIPGNPQSIQPTALVIMDLKTDRIIQRHVFNTSLLRPNTNLASVTVDVTKDNCNDAYAYIPDLGGFGLIVYSLRENKAWRVTHNYFYLEPLAGEFSIGGHDFQWNDGIFSIAISDVKSDGFRDAYFHSMAGFNLYRVSTRVLRDETLATRSFHGSDFQFVGNRGNLSQTSSSDLHASKGILFLGLVNQNALGCWNIRTPLSDISVVQKNDRTMIYPSDVKIRDDYVIVLTNTMPVFLYGTLDYNVINFRVWVEDVDRAVRETKCASGSRGRY
ncbi:yellow-f [Asbolus verrucosus]|uniref:Yellow-f n=1 Tax=Asbolus verrucosus TaxID=1661398 RepID=A0A482VFZ0_ASBVE|nr:yellow-f [Asbolus verrucosus]